MSAKGFTNSLNTVDRTTAGVSTQMSKIKYGGLDSRHKLKYNYM